MNKLEAIKMSIYEQVDLILWQFKEIEHLKREIIDLTSKNNYTKKTSNNSSIPASKDYKSNIKS